MTTTKIVNKLLVCVATSILMLSFIFTGHGAARAAPISSQPHARLIQVIHLPSGHFNPNTLPANCSASPGGWFDIIANNNEYCYGGPGSYTVSIANVQYILTHNNWGHFNYYSGGNLASMSFSYNQTINLGGRFLDTIYLYQ